MAKHKCKNCKFYEGYSYSSCNVIIKKEKHNEFTGERISGEERPYPASYNRDGKCKYFESKHQVSKTILKNTSKKSFEIKLKHFFNEFKEFKNDIKNIFNG